jgi:glutathione S-transferase
MAPTRTPSEPEETDMIVVHHLKGSRSTRILWLLEELGVPYEVVTHDRLEGGQAAASLAAIHPLGKSPVIVDEGKAIAESGAILDYLARKYGDGKLSVPVESADFADYLYWLHFAEGSALPPLISQVYLRNAGGQAVETVKRLRAQDERNMQLVEDALEGRDFLAGDALSAADIIMQMPMGVARREQADKYPNIVRVLTAWDERPAYKAARAYG